MDVCGLGDVIEADNGEIFGETPSPLSGSLHYAKGHHIVRGENGRRGLRQTQELLRALIALRLHEIPLTHQSGIEGDAVILERRLISIQTLTSTAKLHVAGNKSDAAVPQGKQILHRVIRAAKIGGRDRGGVLPIAEIIDEYVREAALAQRIQVRGGVAGQD